MATLLAETTTEKDLLSLARAGNRGAFGELARRNYPGVIRVVAHMCADPNLAEDAAQEAFLRAWQKMDSYRPTAPFKSWLYRIAINAALDSLRRRTEASIEENEGAAAADPAAGPEAALIEKERTTLVRRALGELPAASRSVLVLREYGGLSYQEISQALDIPIGTVMSRLNYARNTLRKSLGPLIQTENDHE